jgi:biotin carboxyl carrier protein
MATSDVAAEWPGRVAEIHVAAGDSVEAEQELITLESMKMLTPVVAPSAGTVAEIVVAVDDFVDEGGTLLRLDA